MTLPSPPPPLAGVVSTSPATTAVVVATAAGAADSKLNVRAERPAVIVKGAKIVLGNVEYRGPHAAKFCEAPLPDPNGSGSPIDPDAPYRHSIERVGKFASQAKKQKGSQQEQQQPAGAEVPQPGMAGLDAALPPPPAPLSLPPQAFHPQQFA
jgi:hypothetical protein